MKYSKEIGSVFLIVGISVGAGMIAIPLVTFKFGFLVSLVAVFLCWAVMLKAAFLIIDVNYEFPVGTNFQVMANHLLGPFGRVVTWICFVSLMYAGITAYISGGSSIIYRLLGETSIPINHWLSIGLFMVVLSPLVYKGTSWVDTANRILLGIKFLFFGLAVLFLFTEIKLDHYGAFRLTGAETMLPVLVLSFAYQQALPVIRSYLDCSKKKLKILAAIGSSIPLLIYVLWEIAVIGTFPKLGPDGFLSLEQHHGKVGLFLIDYDNYVDNIYFTTFIDVFYNVAVTTSFLGVSLSLFHFNENTYHLEKRKLVNYLITFGIPIAILAFFPDVFVASLSCAGMFAALLMIVLPCWMVLVKRPETAGPAVGRPRNLFSAFWIWVLLIFGLSVAAIQILKAVDILSA
jgi:tyrosine-specific transport protein